ncbi:MAG: glycosyltransferase [Methanobacteriota archaeon]
MTGRRVRVLYVSYDGILEPLGEGQVLHYLERLAAAHEIRLVCFEKPRDLSDAPRSEARRRRGAKAGLDWTPLRYHKRPTGPATFYDVAVGYRAALRLARRHAVEVVHARSYVAAIIGLEVAEKTGARFLFDMRGFFPDQRVDGGSLTTRSLYYRVLKRLERRFLERADAVVSLTEAGAEELSRWPGLRRPPRRIDVIRTCVDLERFRRASAPPPQPLTLAWLGSVGKLYRYDAALGLLAAMRRRRRPDARLLVVNRGQHGAIRSATEAAGQSDAIEIASAPFADVPAALAPAHVGLVLCQPSFSLKAAAPTKMGEFLSMGIPCVAHAGTGDVRTLLECEGAGVVVDSYDPAALDEAAGRLVKLLDDPETPARCRAVAERSFALDGGVEAYDRLYRELSEGR